MLVCITSPIAILYSGLLNIALDLCIVVCPEVLCSAIYWATLKGLVLLCASTEQHEGDSSYTYTYTQHDHCTHNLEEQKRAQRGRERNGELLFFFLNVLLHLEISAEIFGGACKNYPRYYTSLHIKQCVESQQLLWPVITLRHQICYK